MSRCWGSPSVHYASAATAPDSRTFSCEWPSVWPEPLHATSLSRSLADSLCTADFALWTPLKQPEITPRSWYVIPSMKMKERCSLSKIYSSWVATCWRIAPFITSFWMVSLICRRREWGSVQIHTASADDSNEWISISAIIDCDIRGSGGMIVIQHLQLRVLPVIADFRHICIYSWSRQLKIKMQPLRIEWRLVSLINGTFCITILCTQNEHSR